MSSNTQSDGTLTATMVDEALANVRSLLKSDPRAAIQQAYVLLRKTPDPRALRLAASAHRALGDTVHAEMAEHTAIELSSDDPRLEDIAKAQQQGRREDARSMAEAMLRDDPADILALAAAAEAAISLRDFEDSDAKLRMAIERAPNFGRASVLLAASLKIRARVREAIAILEGLVERGMVDPFALNLLSECYAEIGELDRTVSTVERLIALNPAQVRHWIVYAQYLRILGRSAESKTAFRKALALDPRKGAAWWGLAQYFPEELEDADLAEMEQVLIDRAGTWNDEAPTRVALSIVAHRRGDHAEAFQQLAEGKRLRLHSQPYDPARMSHDVDEAIQNLSAELFKKSAGVDDSSPLFIVGMPRSGSTLVERILGQHPQIEATGELQVLSKIVDQLRHRRGQGGSYTALVASLPPSELTEIGASYLDRAAEYRHEDKPKFVDKFNFNWLHSGLIRLVLPNARILDVRRNALDCCWSNFKMLFADGHANDLGHIGKLYRDYVRMMDHVDTVAPGGILRVRYAELIEDVEAVTRRMLEFIGVPFAPECLEFHRSAAPVATPSSEQVRQPINRNAIGSAEPYRQWLGELIEELGPLASA